MRSWIVFLGLWLALTSASAQPRNLAASGATPTADKRIALVIGNAAYPGAAALKNPANDARDIAAKLKRLGFDVSLRTDLRLKDMLRSLTEFGEKITPGTETLFFYAGHGMQVRGKNYLIPLDAEIRGESSVSSEAVDVDQLLDKLAPARLSVVILDACRNNPFERRFRGGGQGLAQINAPTGTLIAYATAPGKVAADGEGRNGLYTAELLAAMDTPGSKIEDVFKRVRANVVKKSQEAQVPWESSSLTGDFYFRHGEAATLTAIAPAAAEAAAAAPSMDSSTAEVAFWESAERGNSEADYSAYLAKYPQGLFAELARNRLARSAKPAAPPAPPRAPTPPSRPEALAAPPLPKLGDTWRYRGRNLHGSDDPVYRVDSVAPDRIEISYTTNINESMRLVLNADWNVIAQHGQRGAANIRFEPPAEYHRFPLTVGKRWQGRYRGECGALCNFEVEYDYEVRGWETVDVPAGRFEALRIEGTDNFKLLFGMSSVGRRTLWLAPGIAQPVKFEYSYDGKFYHAYQLESHAVAP